MAILVLACIAAATAFVYIQAKRRRERREAEQVDRLASDIHGLHETLARLSSFDSGYLMKKDFDQVLNSHTLAAIKKLPERAIQSSIHAKEIAYILQCCENPDYRTLRNKSYKEHELARCKALFSDIDGGKSLDPQQRNAIVTDEYSNLVIAGAGSGKTSVVVGKVKYLIRRWGINPSHILVTSFTRASVDDLKRRIEADGLTGVSTRTFHSLGLKVLGNDVAVAPENALAKHVTAYLSEELASHPYQASAFVEFFGLWSLTTDESLDIREAEVRMKILKAQDMRTLKGFIEEANHQGTHDTLLGERVKSLEEVMIANFLFLNGVTYEYERPYPYEIPEKLYDERRRAYQPDFYLVDYDIWLEHFGIDEHGRVPWMKTAVEEENYLDGIDWKRKVHKACGTTLIESYSYWNSDQDLLNQLEALLKRMGVKLVLDPVRNAEICGSLLRDKQFFGSMTQLISTFISLVKSSNRTAPEVDEIARRAYQGDGAMWHRFDLFTRFAWPIFTSYQASLASAEKPLVDFDDMINKAAERIRKEGYDTPYRYIIVDEYQDISLSRFGLLSAIRDACGAKLMCVGDD